MEEKNASITEKSTNEDMEKTSTSQSTEQNEDTQHNNPSVPDSLLDDLAKIKGDMIGDTVYSERWVLKTMMKIMEKYPEYCTEQIKELETALEEDVCMIWDMSAEPDVARYLIQHDILDLISQVISSCRNARLMEMMVGILGNLACQSEIRKKLEQKKELVNILVSHLSYPDTLSLVQVVRLIRTCLWELRTTSIAENNSWLSAMALSETCDSLAFIIGSSVDADLLTVCLQLMETLVYIKLPNDGGFLGKHYGNSGMVQALVEGLRELTTESSGIENDNENPENETINISSSNIEEACQNWVSTVHGLSFSENGQQAIREQGEQITTLLEAIIRHFLEQDNWKEYLDDQVDFLMCGASLLGLLLPTNFHAGCFACVVTLTERIQGLGAVSLQESLEDCIVSVAAAEGVQDKVLTSLDQCHAPEVELCFRIIAKKDRSLLSHFQAEVHCTNKHQRLYEIANIVLANDSHTSRMTNYEPQR